MDEQKIEQEAFGGSELLRGAQNVVDSILQNVAEQLEAGIKEDSGVLGVNPIDVMRGVRAGREAAGMPPQGAGGADLPVDLVGLPTREERIRLREPGQPIGRGRQRRGGARPHLTVAGTMAELEKIQRGLQRVVDGNLGTQTQIEAGRQELGGIADILGDARREIAEIAPAIGADVGARLDGFLQNVRAVGANPAQVLNVLDQDNNGVVDNPELEMTANSKTILTELQGISPLLKKSIQDPNFRIRKIDKRIVSPDEVLSGQLGTQKDLVQQGYSEYISDINEFNVSNY